MFCARVQKKHQRFGRLSLQIFAIELVSYLCQQFALPKSLGVAKLAVNVMATLLGGTLHNHCSHTLEFAHKRKERETVPVASRFSLVDNYVSLQLRNFFSVMSEESRPEFYLPTLPALVRICKVFPPLCDEAVRFLLQLGRVSASHLASVTNCTGKGTAVPGALCLWSLNEEYCLLVELNCE